MSIHVRKIRPPLAPVVAMACVALGACAAASGHAPTTPAVVATSTAPVALGTTGDGAANAIAARPYGLHVPPGYDPAKATPLVVLLHGYMTTGPKQEAYFGLTAVADAKTFLYAFPDGKKDAHGEQFWNATPACCDFGKSNVDDVAYLTAVIDDVSAHHHVDPRRVYVVGHSNGGFMAHRLACALAPRVAAIVSLAGAGGSDDCTPASPVSVLQIHGDHDTFIRYEGGTIAGAAYPSARETVRRWAARDGCTGALSPTGATLDLAREVAGAETRIERTAGCAAGIDVELWTLIGGKHLPVLARPGWGEAIYGFLSAHPRP